jgi:hypothetical protein
MNIAIASPSRFCIRRLARLYEHELAHIKGFDHEEMDQALLYSTEGVPAWAKGLRIRRRKA